MALTGILIAIFISLLVGALFYFVFKISGPWGTFWSFLVVLVLAGISAEVWVSPVGPVKWGIAWFPPLFVAFILAVLLAAASPPKQKRNTVTSKDQRVAAIGGFFWLLIVFLLGIILWGVVGSHSF